MRLSTRYGLVGMAALALLSSVHWVRDNHWHFGPVGTYLRGVAPNFAAAIAISFVLLSIWTDRQRDDGFVALRLRFLVCAAISGAGLCGWEFVQMLNNRLVFDTQDLVATLVGIAVSAGLFHAITPRRPD
ncbi:hypothetical protein [Novosphingobium sp.]|uniref:hypothetical protein n=1 Tax=Novosphingobium sp. TaxID=1874826 RepID=UPI0038BCFB6F